jgi:hypothetical protein
MSKHSVQDRFWSKVQIQHEGCWIWTGAISGDTGYGIFWDGIRLIGAHRYAYQLVSGPLPADRPFVCHACDNRACVNPAHLFPGSNRENVQDSIGKGRWRRPYVPPPPRASITPAERFWRKVRQNDDGCWEWTGAIRGGGYGHVRVSGRNTGAHRYAYELVYGPIAAGNVICHRCDNPRCVRPDHLFAGTTHENMRDCREKGRLGEKRRLGSTNGSTKITHEIAVAIREARASGRSRADVAKQFGISVWAVTQVTNGNHWTANGGPVGQRGD